MSRYAIELGKVVLRSDKPITDEQRKRALEQLRKRGDDALLSLGDDLEVCVVVR